MITIGERFGRWVVLRKAAQRRWTCRCDCGAESDVWDSNLKRALSASCGCAPKRSRRPKHGHARRQSREYMAWTAMLSRCRNPRAPNYYHYGARGIEVCARWEDFRNFLSDMGPRPVGMTLDRINNERGYEPGNCRWATFKQQAENRSTTRWIEINGVRKTLTEWSRAAGITDSCLRGRLKNGEAGPSLLRPSRWQISDARAGQMSLLEIAK